ncbi:hypothetical protein LCGC14_2514230 [marine sediment metagenome]|uniref:DegT/DnrJ/EryC1/StrS aminotransferase family protein n=1 Tax=marine sediment metagenome TaxID=412755 RepID=A0A0F9AYR7_9ZZZZ
MELKEKIPYHKPLQFSALETEILIAKIKGVLKSGMLTNDEYVRELEFMIGDMYGVEYCIATSNCTMGLFLSFQCLQSGLLLDIEMPNFTWMSPYMMFNGYPTHFIDIDKETWLMKDIGTGIKLSFPTHTFGNLIEISNSPVIYDGAHALGSRIKEFGDATVLSLAPTKLVTSCEGGLVLTNQQYLAEFVRFRRDRCARMSEIHALIGLATLEHLDMILAWKEEVQKSMPLLDWLLWNT